MIQLHDVEQGSQEWHDAREGMYTGSNADKLLLNANSRTISSGIIRQYATAEASGFGGNFFTKRGHLLEDEAIELYEAIHGVTVLRPGYVTNTFYPGCLYSPDGLDRVWLLEVKCFMESKHLAMIGGNIPLKIKAQIHYGMFITGKRKAKLIVYNPKLDAKLAYKEIVMRWDPNIGSNFKKILGGK